MVVFKCKMCGGDLQIQEEATVCECEYCGTKQTVPSADDEKKLQLFNRANRLRFNNEFDKAAGVYESIVAEFPEEAESYWGLVLCDYGIEYVDDEKTGKKIPTCHRTVPVSVMDDKNFEQACEYAGSEAKAIYREEAKAIDRIQKSILSIVENEEPYDIFICYKETDENGLKTVDSILAQDIYTELVKENYKVFFSRVTLREVAGSDYEAYIYAALKSAKVMLAIGTKYDYYDAVWVKNEWRRYLSMMATDKEKHLIPCFKDLDAYDMPKEFKNLQALDMGEVTFFKNLLSNIEKCIKKDKKDKLQKDDTPNVSVVNNNLERLLQKSHTYIKLENIELAKNTYKTVTEEYPEDYRGWWGLITCETDNLTKIDVEITRIETWYRYVKTLAEPEAFKVLEEAYIEYLKKFAEKSASEDVELFKVRIKKKEMLIDETKAEIGVIENTEKSKRKHQYDTAFNKLEEKIKETQKFVSEQKEQLGVMKKYNIIAVVFVLLGPVMALIFSNGAFILFSLLSFPFMYLSSEKGSKKELLKIISSNEQNIEQHINEQETEKIKLKNDLKDLDGKIRNLNDKITFLQGQISLANEYISLGEEKISTYWFEEKCKDIGIERLCDESIKVLREKALNDNALYGIENLEEEEETSEEERGNILTCKSCGVIFKAEEDFEESQLAFCPGCGECYSK
ncbi:MAG: TIR domain-containing protein [Ruminococcaceae bacterium]|nr:TIR domain-containing protein [Oscillospiraceae bacterium]